MLVPLDLWHLKVKLSLALKKIRRYGKVVVFCTFLGVEQEACMWVVCFRKTHGFGGLM